ncbi:hypothetical protein [Stenotrophomonas sp. MMGLT7]|uniref:hypothetical protein n=1 Tax=Stenotrophomonas sp. MMGLT7 TaxID=2901227 RepID=UPI001E38A58B|nr:hypothetical protein [Stenotrophomonas sp. MMGLT7]MCD7099073.1 hypothetical protein [Stenotrophomonas sp. MMGLT7]
MTEKYRPSNGTEGDGFICAWCRDCQRSEHLQEIDDGGLAPVGCRIADLTMLHDVDDPEYPAEWTFDQFGLLQCSAYVPAGEPVPPSRCSRTQDMFPETTP